MLMRRRDAAEDGVRIAPACPQAFDAAVAAAAPVHAFLRSAWFEAAAPDLRRLVATRADGSPLAAIAIARRGPSGLIREVAGSYWPYRSLPVAADARVHELAAVLADRGLRRALGPVWRMGPVFADDPAAALLLPAAVRAGWTMLTRSLGACFDIDLAALLAEGPWPRTSSLAGMRRRGRKLEEAGPLEYRFATGRDWTAGDRDAIARIERESWLGGEGAAADAKFADPARRRSWEQVAQDPVVASMLFCSLLHVGGEPAAFAFGVEAGGVRHCIANSFSQRFARHSPGKLLLYADFARAAERGVARIGWGAGDAGYKGEMGATEGPAILDHLFVRPRPLAAALRPWWERARHG